MSGSDKTISDIGVADPSNQTEINATTMSYRQLNLKIFTESSAAVKAISMCSAFYYNFSNFSGVGKSASEVMLLNFMVAGGASVSAGVAVSCTTAAVALVGIVSGKCLGISYDKVKKYTFPAMIALGLTAAGGAGYWGYNKANDLVHASIASNNVPKKPSNTMFHGMSKSNAIQLN